MDLLFRTDCQSNDRIATESRLILVMPFIDREAAERSAPLIAGRAACDGLLIAVEDTTRTGFVSIINQLFRNSRSTFFGYVAQDAFAGRNWGKLALHAFEQEKRGLLGFNDGKWQGMLASFGLARRTWAEGNYQGDFFFPGYFGHYADVELTLLALQSGSYAYDPNCVMIEVDYEKDLKGVFGADRDRYLVRLASAFDGRVTSTQLLSIFR